MKRLPWLVVTVLMPLAMMAQASRAAGPVAGLLADAAAGTLRPVMGLPGSAYAGRAVAEGLRAMLVSRDGQSAFVQKGDTLFLVQGLGADQEAEWRELGSGAGEISAAWSADASVLAVWRADDKKLSFWRNGESAGSADADVAKVLAVDSGARAVVTSRDSVLLLGADGERRVLATDGGASAAAFAGTDAFILRGSELWVASADAFTLFTGGLEDAVGLAVSPDSKLLIVARAGEAKRVDLVDRETRTLVRSVALDFAPLTVAPMSGGIFLLDPGEAGKRPAQVLDTRRDWAVFFIPIPGDEPAASGTAH